MTCPHCNVDHSFEVPPWPSDWDEYRQRALVDLLKPYGLQGDSLQIAASEIHRLWCGISREINEHTLVEYLEDTRRIASKLHRVDVRRERLLGWSKKLLGIFKAKERDSAWTAASKILASLMLAGPLMIYTIPVRIYFKIRRQAIERKFHSTFISWLVEVKGY